MQVLQPYPLLHITNQVIVYRTISTQIAIDITSVLVFHTNTTYHHGTSILTIHSYYQAGNTISHNQYSIQRTVSTQPSLDIISITRTSSSKKLLSYRDKLTINHNTIYVTNSLALSSITSFLKVFSSCD